MRERSPEHHAEHLKKIYRREKKNIIERLTEFREIGNSGSDEDIFCELAFCILTPQSNAKACWASITRLCRKDTLLRGTPEQIKRNLHCVRFHNKKAEYLVSARTLFMRDGRLSIKHILGDFPDPFVCREWLVKNIKGLGYKEASHFLRNIGLGSEIAILDRHILRNLLSFGVIKEIPESISRTRYTQIEKTMHVFAKEVRIPIGHLDLLLWYKETGEIFK